MRGFFGTAVGVLVASTTWLLIFSYQTDDGIKERYQPGISSKQRCEQLGEAWLEKQPDKFDWFFAYRCEPQHQTDPAARGNDLG